MVENYPLLRRKTAHIASTISTVYSSIFSTRRKTTTLKTNLEKAINISINSSSVETASLSRSLKMGLPDFNDELEFGLVFSSKNLTTLVVIINEFMAEFKLD